MNVVQELETRMHPDSVTGFRQLVGDARIADPILLSERAMVRMVAPAQWLLGRVGEGIKLTRDGYLPPAVVTEAAESIAWNWPVPSTREVNLRPLLAFRQHLHTVRLLRVKAGVLHTTVKGRTLATQPRALWLHLAHTIFASNQEYERDAVKVLLVLMATRKLDQRDQYSDAITRGIHSLSWASPDGSPLDADDALDLVIEKWRIMVRLGVFEPGGYGVGGWIPTIGGAAFARAALQANVPTR